MNISTCAFSKNASVFGFLTEKREACTYLRGRKLLSQVKGLGFHDCAERLGDERDQREQT